MPRPPDAPDAAALADDDAALADDAESLTDDTASLDADAALATGANAAASRPPLAPTEVAAAVPAHRRRARLLEASSLLVLVALIWVSASDLTQILFRDSGQRLPFFITWLCTCELSLLLLLRLAREAWARRRRRLSPPPVSSDPFVESTRAEWRAALRAALVIAPLWLTAQATFNGALAGTSVTSSTVLSSTSSAFTLILARFVLGEHANLFKVTGVALTVLGSGLTGLSDSEAAPSSVSSSSSVPGPAPVAATWWGDALAIVSAILYACYTVALKRLLSTPADAPPAAPDDATPRESYGTGLAQPCPHAPTSAPVPVPAPAATPAVDLVFGFVGLLTLLLAWPAVAAMHASGLEPLSGASPRFLAVVLAKGLVDNVLSDLLWAHAVQLSGPTLATVALSLTIPLAVASDVLLLQGARPGPLLAAGCVLVVAGFLLSGLGEEAAAEGAARGADGADGYAAVVEDEAGGEGEEGGDREGDRVMRVVDVGEGGDAAAAGDSSGEEDEDSEASGGG